MWPPLLPLLVALLPLSRAGGGGDDDGSGYGAAHNGGNGDNYIPTGHAYLKHYEAEQGKVGATARARAQYEALLAEAEAERAPEFGSKDEDPCFDGDACGHYGDVGDDPSTWQHTRRPVPVTTVHGAGDGPNDGSFLKRHVRRDGKVEEWRSFKLLQTHMQLSKTHPERNTPFLTDPDTGKPQHMFTVVQQFKIDLPAVHAVKFIPHLTVNPLLTRPEDGMLVHHMDLMMCTEALGRYPTVTTALDGTMDAKSECDAIVFAYDRGAGAFTLPENVGFRMGAGTPYSRFYLEWHYMLPGRTVASLVGVDHFVDGSGVEVVFTRQLRQHSAGAFGAMNENMVLPPGQRRYLYSFSATPAALGRVLGYDDDGDGDDGESSAAARLAERKHVFAAHLHMHDHGKRIWIDHLRRVGGGGGKGVGGKGGGVGRHKGRWKKIGEFGRFDHFRGYGPDQEWQHLLGDGGEPLPRASLRKPRFVPGNDGPGATYLQPGDMITVNCVFDTKDATSFGSPPATKPISGDAEMCGPLLLFYPHDPTKRFKQGSYIGDQFGGIIDHTPCATCGSTYYAQQTKDTKHGRR